MSGPNYKGIALEIAETVEKKQAAYGDSFGKSGEVMRIFYPKGIAPEQMDDALAVIRVVDKLFRVATDRDALGESPWRDIGGYSILGVARTESKPVEETPGPPCMVGMRCTRCRAEWAQEFGARSPHQCPPFEPQT